MGTYLLIPGRHLVNTRFQEEYLFRHVRPPVDHLVFAITSCNQSHSRYNPVPFHVRAIGVDRFAREVASVLGVRYSIVGIPHHRPTERFTDLLLKEVREQSGGELDLNPENTRVVCSTPPLIRAWQEDGFQVLPAEAEAQADGGWKLVEPAPIDMVRRLGELGQAGLDDEWLRCHLHPVWISLLRDFPTVTRTIQELYSEPLLKDEGSLTETRDYDTYVRAMGGAIELKYRDIRPFLLPGRIIDEGCADGALLARIADDFPDSDLIGVDLSAEMLARAAERQRAGDFSGCFAFFRQCNLMKPLPLRNPVDTTLCNSTLHEIWSFGEGEASVRKYLAMKRDQLRTGGRLVIRDVVGPEERLRTVRLWCSDAPGKPAPDAGSAQAELDRLSLRQRFQRFAADFLPKTAGRAFSWEEAATPRGPGFRLSLQSAMEFLMKMDYTDNWQSEMLEEFCFWSFTEWQQALEEAGFRVVEGSRAYVNDWRVRNSFEGHVALFDADGAPLPFPVTNMVLVGERL